MASLRLKPATYSELLKLKALAEIVAGGKRVTYDELLQSMVAVYQQILEKGKISVERRPS